MSIWPPTYLDIVDIYLQAAANDDIKVVVQLTDARARRAVPLQLPEHMSYPSHRTVAPVLHSLEKPLCLEEDRSRFSGWFSPEEQSTELFSPMSSQFLVPPDYEAVFSGQQTLRVSGCSQVSVNDLSPASSVFTDSIPEATTEGKDFEFSPDFNRVLSEFEKTVSEFDSEEPKVPLRRRRSSESPRLSDSDAEFFDCKQAFSDVSEAEEARLQPDPGYHISEPPSPQPLSSGHHFLHADNYKRSSSGSESLCEFAYDSEGSQTCRAEGDLPVCEELPSRSQAECYDDDDFLGGVRG